MSRFIAVLGVGIAMAVACCKSRSESSRSEEMPRSEVEAKLLKTTGLEIPESATSVSGSEMSMFTYVFDCSFECSIADLREAWKRAPILAEKVAPDELVPGEGAPSEAFDGKWSAGGGTQFVIVELRKLDGESVLVEVRTTHEEK